MEARKITVVQTKCQKKSVIMSSATTLGELKADLRANGIDYDGMTFFEGLSKIELKTDVSVLPHDVPYKGQVTNELVFMLTNTNKKIRSGGMSRLEAYKAIKSMGLQDACAKKFGKNFTMCKTADLVALVQSNDNSNLSSATLKAEATKIETRKEVETPAPETAVPVDVKSNSGECVDVAARAVINKLVNILENNGVITDYEKDEILDFPKNELVCESKSTSSYSKDEISDMFDFVG